MKLLNSVKVAATSYQEGLKIYKCSSIIIIIAEIGEHLTSSTSEM